MPLIFLTNNNKQQYLVISSKGKGREKEGGDNEEERVLFRFFCLPVGSSLILKILSKCGKNIQYEVLHFHSHAMC